MIRAGDVVQRTRLVAGDMQAGRYSDYEVYAALNAAVDVLCEGLRRYFSPELVRRAVLTPKDGRCALPEGFLYLSEVDCDSDWRIEGDFSSVRTPPRSPMESIRGGSLRRRILLIWRTVF